MAEQFLGVGFDIHGGGSDLVFPHHENEAAQTRAARGRELSRLWMHNGMIQFTGEKMAKSVGNIALLHEVLDEYGAETVVMYLISGHYRQPLAFSKAALEQARANVSASARQGGGCPRENRRPSWSDCATASSTRLLATSTQPRRCRCSMSGSARQPVRRRLARRRAPARDARCARVGVAARARRTGARGRA